MSTIIEVCIYKFSDDVPDIAVPTYFIPVGRDFSTKLEDQVGMALLEKRHDGVYARVKLFDNNLIKRKYTLLPKIAAGTENAIIRIGYTCYDN